MSSLRPGIVSGLAFALFTTVAGGGCASTYAPPGLPAPRDFGVDDLAGSGTGGNGDEDMAGGGDLAVAAGADLAMARDLQPSRDLLPACLIDDVDGFAARALYVAAPAAGGVFAARFSVGGGAGGGGAASWTALTPAAGNVTDVALATAAGRPVIAARLSDATLAAAAFDGCRGFGALTAIAAGAATGARPALVGGGSADLVFRGNTGGDQRYFWAHFDGSGWGAVAAQGNFLSTLAPTALRLGGAVHVVFAGTDTNLWDGVVQATGGGTSTQLTGNTSTQAPAAALAPDGRLHVVYTGTNKHVYWFVASAPGTVHDLCDGQPPSCFIITDFAPALVVGSDGAPVALFRGTDNKLYASKLAGTQWGAAALVSGADTTTLAPAAAGGGSDGVVDVVYVRDGDHLARHAQLTGGGWQAATTISTTALTGAPALAAAP